TSRRRRPLSHRSSCQPWGRSGRLTVARTAAWQRRAPRPRSCPLGRRSVRSFRQRAEPSRSARLFLEAEELDPAAGFAAAALRARVRLLTLVAEQTLIRGARLWV